MSNLPNSDNDKIKVYPNEYITNSTINRPNLRLLANDLYLESIMLSSGISNHAQTHTNGMDDIQNATTTQKGLMTIDQVNQLNNTVQLTGDQLIVGTKNINGNLNIYGTFTANSAVFNNLEQSSTSANFIQLNNNVTGSVLPSQDAGVRVIRGTEPPAELRWNETSNKWTAGVTGDMDNIVLQNQLSSFIPLSGSSDISGNLTPSLTTLTLGSLSNPWKEGYFSDSSIYLGDYQFTKQKATQWDNIQSTVIANSGQWDESHDISALSSQIDTNVANILTNANNINTLDNTVDSNIDAINSLDDDINFLSAAITGVETDINTLSSEVNGNIIDINLLNDAIDENTTDINTLSSEVNGNIIDIDLLNEEIVKYIPLSGSDQISGSLTPAISTLTLGTSDNPWKEGYFSSGSVYLGDVELSTDGTDLLVNGDAIAGSITRYTDASLDTLSTDVIQNASDIANLSGDYQTGDTIDIDYTASNYNATSANISGHFDGINNAIGNLSGGWSYLDTGELIFSPTEGYTEIDDTISGHLSGIADSLETLNALTGNSDISTLQKGQIDFFVPGNYNPSVQSNILTTIGHTYSVWRQSSATINTLYATHHGIDSTTQPYIALSIDGSALSAIQLSGAGTWVSQTLNASITAGQTLNIDLTSLSGGAGDAEDLTVSLEYTID